VLVRLLHESVSLPDDLEESDKKPSKNQVDTEANEEDIHRRITLEGEWDGQLHRPLQAARGCGANSSWSHVRELPRLCQEGLELLEILRILRIFQ
jgi:hypothetical protein